MTEIVKAVLDKIQAKIMRLTKLHQELCEEFGAPVAGEQWQSPPVVSIEVGTAPEVQHKAVKPAKVAKAPAGKPGFVLTQEIERIAGKWTSFTSSLLRTKLIEKHPAWEKQIGWGLSNALRRMESRGELKSRRTEGSKDLAWSWAKNPVAAPSASAASEALRREIHAEIAAAKPQGEE